jgi:hypothetical protein
MITWPRHEVLRLCQSYGALLPEIEGIKPAQLLAALAMNESSLGLDCGPRHESSWDVGGKYASDPQQAKNLSLYPYAAACSYGPLQIMFYNVPGYAPNELNTNLPLVMRASISYLSRQIRRFAATTVEEIGQIWNHGSPVKPPAKPSPGVQLYCRDLIEHYTAAEGWLESC